MVNKKCVELLLKNGASDTIVNNIKKETAFQIAVRAERLYGNPESWKEMKISDEELEKECVETTIKS